MNIYNYILLFFIYSFVGWIVEVINLLIETKKFVNRGFLIGPYVPIYGTGAVLATGLLGNSNLDIFSLFIITALLSGIVEYSISFIMEKLFDARWWDYSDRKFNLNGRICLGNLVLFGIGSMLALKLINPFIINLINLISFKTLKMIDLILILIFLIDIIITIITLFKIKNKIKVSLKKDASEEVSELIKKELLKGTHLIKRIILSYPKVKIIIKKIKEINK